MRFFRPRAEELRDLLSLKDETPDGIGDGDDPKQVLKPSENGSPGGQRHRPPERGAQIIRRDAADKDDHIAMHKQNSKVSNRGQAGKIFEEVKQSGVKVVMKNNAAECVQLFPDEYIRLMDEINDARLMTIAAQRMEKFDPVKTVSRDECELYL